jgi:AcrR family transcriptional regulator
MIRKLSPEKRESFLSAALKLFVENGLQGTSTAAIAKEAGTASGTLFLYFPTKQDLIDELVLKIGREQSETITTRLDPGLSAQEMFQRIWDASIRWFMMNLEAYEYIQVVRDSGVISEEVIEDSGQLFSFYYAAIQKGLAEGTIKPYPLELIGEMLYRDIVAVMNLIKEQPTPELQEKYLQSGFEIFWNGIKASEV